MREIFDWRCVMKYINARIADKVDEYYTKGEVVATNFLDPSELVEINSILSHVDNVPFGGYDNAERKVVIIGADEDFDDFSKFISVVRATSNATLSHRNVLGSVLGLGLKREMIGDILINDNFCDIIVVKTVAEFLLNNLKSVGREKVNVTEVATTDIVPPIENSKEITASVNSMRVDAIVSAGFGLPREKSAALVKGEMVKINFVVVKNASKAVNVGDVISVRGNGRIEVCSIGGNTKSGRTKVVLSRK